MKLEKLITLIMKNSTVDKVPSRVWRLPYWYTNRQSKYRAKTSRLNIDWGGEHKYKKSELDSD